MTNLINYLKLTMLLAALFVGQAAWAESTWTVTNNDGKSNTFTIKRSETGYAQTVHYRTVGLSAYAGQHFIAASGSISFDADEDTKTVTVTEMTPDVNALAYKFQTGDSRKYRFDVTDAGGFYLAHCDREITTGTSVTSSGAFDIKDVTIQSAGYTADDDGYDQNPVKYVASSGYFNNAAPKTYYQYVGAELRMKLSFKAKENDDAYEYLQILFDNISTCDNRSGAGDGNPGTPSLSKYMAGFEMNNNGQDADYKSYTFPVTTVGDNASAANPWGHGTSYPLTNQKFKSGSRATDGRLIVPMNFSQLVLRLNASGKSGTDEWAVKEVKAHIQAVETTAPTKLAVSVAPGRYSKGNTVYVSVAFSEIVTVTGTPTLTTTDVNNWGSLSYVDGSGTNVLTFSTTIPADAIGNLNITGLSGTVKDLAGNSPIGSSVTASNLCSLDANYVYTISYNLDGGSVAAENPVTYTYETAEFTLNNPTRDNYDFIGWTGSNGEGPQSEVTIDQYSHGDLIYTANWGQALTTMEAGTYHITEDMSISTTINITGDVTLVIDKGVELKASRGIIINSGKTLTMQGQGTLTVLNKVAKRGPNYNQIEGYDGGTGDVGYAAITGNVVVNSGKVSVTGGRGGMGGTGSPNDHIAYGSGAVPPGGNGGDGGTGGSAIDGSLTVNGGKVTIAGGRGGQAGSAGAKAPGQYHAGFLGAGGIGITGSLVVNGGTVNVRGGDVGPKAAYGNSLGTHGSGKALSGTSTITCTVGGSVIQGSSDNSTWTAIASGSTSTNKYVRVVANYTLDEAEGITESIAEEIAAGVAATFTRTFKAGVPSTICLPFTMKSENTGGTFYEFVGLEYDDTEHMWVATMRNTNSAYSYSNYKSTAEANNPYIFLPDIPDGKQEGDDVELTFTGTAASTFVPQDQNANTKSFPDAEGWTLKGTYKRLLYKADGSADLTGYVYGFASKDKNVDGVDVAAGEFVKAKDGASVPAFRAYLTYQNGAEYTGAPARGMTRGKADLPQTITVRFVSSTGDTTSIGTLNTETGEITLADGWYTLSGRKLNGKPTQRGIYINNGKKVVLR